MKRSITLSLLISCATLAWPQASTPKASTPAPPPASASSAPASNEPKGPEAVAQKEPNKVVATINGKQLTAKEAADMLSMIPEQQRRNAGNLEKMLEQIYLVTDLAKKAEGDHLDQQAPYKQQIQLSRDQILAQAYMSRLTNVSSAPPTDPKQYYDAHPEEFDTAKLSGIAIAFNPPGTPANPNGPNRTEQEARQKADDVEKKIKAGADVSTLARTDSDDQRSASQGGSLGTLSAAAPNVPSEIKDTVFKKLQPGQVSEPIRLPNAFYIIKLESRTKEPYDQARDNIVQKLQADKNQAVVKQEMDKYKLQIDDPNFFATSSGTVGAKTPSLKNPSGSTSPSASASQPGTHK
ncbi:MAG: peptidylprolyl isomerase [Acidobacteriaceae bacterium]|nr:peptidylprolyl isomerase [Acidobacteriaceae bacterium]